MLEQPVNLVPRYLTYAPKDESPELLKKQASVTWCYEDFQAIANLARDFHQERDKVGPLIEALKKHIPENVIVNLIPLIPLYDYPLTSDIVKVHQRVHNNAFNAAALLEFPADSFDPLIKGK